MEERPFSIRFSFIIHRVSEFGSRCACQMNKKASQLRRINFKLLSINENAFAVLFTMDTEQLPGLDGGPLKGLYEFSQLHFHWGNNDTYGSEDALNGKHFPMELHMVFFKKEYGDMKNAINHADGLSVMAFFYQISSKPNPAYEELTELVASIKLPHSNATFPDPITLNELVHANTHQYYVYNGSLTTPPCSEVVTWLDFYEPIDISHDQVRKLEKLYL